MRRSIPVLVLLLLAGCASTGARRSQACQQEHGATPRAVSDQRLLHRLRHGGTALVKQGKTAAIKALVAQLGRKQCSLKLPAPGDQRLAPQALYRKACRSVVLVGRLYPCKKCRTRHASAASGFLISASGAFVTSYHVVSGEGHLVVLTRDGKVHGVKEVLAADEAADFAILQLEGQGFEPLPLRKRAEVGTPIWVVSHPDSSFYSLTTGIVSRYARRKTTEMVITADFARGSSGGPVLDATGAVVGVVKSTRSIYYKQHQQQNLQLVFKYCVPARAVLGAIK